MLDTGFSDHDFPTPRPSTATRVSADLGGADAVEVRDQHAVDCTNDAIALELAVVYDAHLDTLGDDAGAGASAVAWCTAAAGVCLEGRSGADRWRGWEQMTQWQCAVHTTAIDPRDPLALLEDPGESDESPWSAIERAGADGWELVNTLPLVAGGETVGVVWTFKRPKEGG